MNNTKNHKTIAGFPRNTFIFICFLTILVAILSWFRLFYHPPQTPIATVAPSPTLESKLSKIPKPSLPENIIRPLSITSVSLETHTNLPLEMSLLSATPSSLFRDSAQQAALKLKLPQTKPTPPDLTWKNNLATLIANTDDQSLTYYLNTPPATTSAVPDPSKSDILTRNFLSSLNFWKNNISLNKNATVFLQAQALDLMPVKHAQNASLVQLSYQYLIDNVPVVISTQENPISIQIANNSQVTNFTVYPLSIMTNKKDVYPLVTIDKIGPLIQNQTARLINLEPQEYTNSPTSTEISTFSISSIQLAYYFSPTQNLLYPAYLIKGEGKFSDSTKTTLTFLLPAIDPNYYK